VDEESDPASAFKAICESTCDAVGVDSDWSSGKAHTAAMLPRAPIYGNSFMLRGGQSGGLSQMAVVNGAQGKQGDQVWVEEVNQAEIFVCLLTCRSIGAPPGSGHDPGACTAGDDEADMGASVLDDVNERDIHTAGWTQMSGRGEPVKLVVLSVVPSVGRKQPPSAGTMAPRGRDPLEAIDN